MDSQVKSEPVDGIMIKEQGMFKTMQKQAMRVTGLKVITNLPSFFQRSSGK